MGPVPDLDTCGLVATTHNIGITTCSQSMLRQRPTLSSTGRLPA